MIESEEQLARVKRLGIMWDSESMGLDSTSIVRELAFVAFDLDDPDTIVRDVEEFLPLEPQELMERRVSIRTVGWLLDQPKSVHEAIKANITGDLAELQALVRSVIQKFQRIIEGAESYECWFARPQHDIPMIRSLLRNVGLELPWRYDSVNDLRTLMNQAGIPIRHPDLDELKKGLTLHTARGDCLFQIRCYGEAQRRLRAAR